VAVDTSGPACSGGGGGADLVKPEPGGLAEAVGPRARIGDVVEAARSLRALGARACREPRPDGALLVTRTGRAGAGCPDEPRSTSPVTRCWRVPGRRGARSAALTEAVAWARRRRAARSRMRDPATSRDEGSAGARTRRPTGARPGDLRRALTAGRRPGARSPLTSHTAQPTQHAQAHCEARHPKTQAVCQGGRHGHALYAASDWNGLRATYSVSAAPRANGDAEHRAFIAWGLITALFIPNRLLPNARFASWSAR